MRNLLSRKSPIALTVCVAATSAAGLLAAPSQVLAQESLIEEVVVTARKREESLQNVPVAVTALSPSQIEQSGVQTVIDVAKLVPNVELHAVTQSGASLGASIRGMAFDDLEKSYEPTVGVSIDGVFMASNSGAVVDFFDVEAIEVLRGPQGTLYGRNTIAGVINIKRTKPTGELGVKLEGTFAKHDRQDLKGIVNLPLGEKGGVKLHWRDLEMDSHLYNETTNQRPYNRDSQVWGAAIRYDFTDNFTATLSYDDYEHWTQPPDVVATGTGDAVFCAFFSLGCNADSGALSEAGGYRTSYASEQIYSYLWGENLTLNAQYSGSNYAIKYIYGEMDFEEEAFFNSWGAPTPLFEVLREQEYEQSSHEIQYLSDWDGAVNIVAGLYYLETESYITSGPKTQSPAAMFTTTQDAEATAVFGEVIWDLNDNWTLTAGARWTKEEKALDNRTFGSNEARRAGAPIANRLTPDYDDTNVTYRFVIQRDLSFGMVYGSYATGYRAGGFNARGSNEPTVGPYESEEVGSWELGLRTQPTDRSQFNVTAFVAEYTDKQQFIVTDGTQCDLGATSTCTFIRNAAETTNQGIEIEAVWMPTERLTIRGTYGYLDAEFDSYDFDGTDISDRAQVIYAPENTFSLMADHTSTAFGGSLVLSGTWSYRSDIWGAAAYESYNYDTGPDINIESHNQLDLSATWLRDLGAGQLKLLVYGTDVLDGDGRVARAYDAGAFSWSELVPGRQIGLTIGYEF